MKPYLIRPSADCHRQCRTPLIQFRGCRAGCHKKRHIACVNNAVPSKTGIRWCKSTKMKRTVNMANLTNIPCHAIFNQLPVRFATWNVRSLKAKAKSAALCDFIIDNKIDIVAITETWLSGDDRDNHTIADIQNTLPNYIFHHRPRPQGKGGGIAILARDGFKI